MLHAADYLSWEWDDLREHVAHIDPGDGFALARSWMEAHPAFWLGTCLPEIFSQPFGEGAPRTQLLDALTAMAPASGPPDYPRSQVYAEMGRGLGKTSVIRGLLLWMLLSGRHDAAVVVGEKAKSAEEATQGILRLFPTVSGEKSGEQAGDPRIRSYHETPLGMWYPDARVSGGVERLELHLGERRTAIVWAAGAESQIRGRLAGHRRPTVAILDDIITGATAWSDAVTEKRLTRLIGDEVRYLGSQLPPRPCHVVLAGNAYRSRDLGERIAADQSWQVIRGSVWVDAAGAPSAGPPQSDAKTAVLELLRDPALTVAERAARAAPLITAALLQGHRPADPVTHTALALLAAEAADGTRAYLRAACCVRAADGTALWPWASVRRLATVDPREVRSVGIWLDPRYSADAERNDFAAAAAVGRLSDGRRVVLAVEEARCSPLEATALYWRAVDRAAALAPWASLTGGCEANGGVKAYLAADFDRDATARAARGLPAPVPELIFSTQKKTGPDRLERLSGPIERGDLLILAGALSPEAERQCEVLGTDYHDDAPDAIERADNLAAPPVSGFAAWMASPD